MWIVGHGLVCRGGERVVGASACGAWSFGTGFEAACEPAGCFQAFELLVGGGERDAGCGVDLACVGLAAWVGEEVLQERQYRRRDMDPFPELEVSVKTGQRAALTIDDGDCGVDCVLVGNRLDI
ncbi:hypothetical protein ACIRQF_30580 [Streptomyces sp. NPDC101191]|uniref:hypothetical protein n=1 Tax=Streptomyces sp. NPDC101191 TaxID=3366126 RepID=UPI003815F8E0